MTKPLVIISYIFLAFACNAEEQFSSKQKVIDGPEKPSEKATDSESSKENPANSDQKANENSSQDQGAHAEKGATQSQNPNSQNQNKEGNAEKQNPTEARKITLIKADHKNCQTIFPDAEFVTVASTKDLDKAALNAKSVLVFDLKGNADHTIESARSDAVRGMCIGISGNARFQLTMAMKVTDIYYNGSGNGEAKIVLKKEAVVSNVYYHANGSNHLAILGEDLTCSPSSVAKQGNGRELILCGGK